MLEKLATNLNARQQELLQQRQVVLAREEEERQGLSERWSRPSARCRCGSSSSACSTEQLAGDRLAEQLRAFTVAHAASERERAARCAASTRAPRACRPSSRPRPRALEAAKAEAEAREAEAAAAAQHKAALAEHSAGGGLPPRPRGVQRAVRHAQDGAARAATWPRRRRRTPRSRRARRRRRRAKAAKAEEEALAAEVGKLAQVERLGGLCAQLREGEAR